MAKKQEETKGLTLQDVQDAADAKATTLTTKFGKKVHALIFSQEDGDTPDRLAVGFLREPNRMDKVQAMDLAFQSPMRAGIRLLEMGLIKEESDPRFLNDDPAYDAINIGAYQKALTIVQYSSDLAKKKEK